MSVIRQVLERSFEIRVNFKVYGWSVNGIKQFVFVWFLAPEPKCISRDVQVNNFPIIHVILAQY